MTITLTVAALVTVAASELAATACAIRGNGGGQVASRPVTRHRRPSVWRRHPKPWATARGAIDDVMSTLSAQPVPYELKPDSEPGRHSPELAIGSLTQRRLDDTMRIPPYIDAAEVA